MKDGEGIASILGHFPGTRTEPDHPCTRNVGHPHEPHFWWENDSLLYWCRGD